MAVRCREQYVADNFFAVTEFTRRFASDLVFLASCRRSEKQRLRLFQGLTRILMLAEHLAFDMPSVIALESELRRGIESEKTFTAARDELDKLASFVCDVRLADSLAAFPLPLPPKPE